MAETFDLSPALWLIAAKLSGFPQDNRS